MVWLLPTRGREQLCQDTLNECARTGMVSPGIVVIDSRVDSYDKLTAPPNWKVLRLPLDMADCMRLVFTLFPDEDCYGWLADDLIPRTPQWDVALEAATQGYRLVDCNDDGYLSRDASLRSRSLCGAFCWGGDLVRAVGWWALPGVVQAGIDDAWIYLTVDCVPLRTYRDDIIVEHRNYRTGKRPQDLTDEWSRDGVAYVDKDMDMMRTWRRSADAQHAVQQLHALHQERQKWS